MPHDTSDAKTNARVHLEQARSLFHHPTYDEALAAAIAAIQIDPDCVEAYQLCHAIHLIKLDYQSAIENLTALLHCKPDSVLALSNRALAYLSARQPAEALRDADQAIALTAQKKQSKSAAPADPWEARHEEVMKQVGVENIERVNLAELYNTRALALSMLGRHEEAGEDWQRNFLLTAKEEAIEESDRQGLVERLLHRGEQHQEAGHDDDAIQAFSAAILRAPENPDARYRRGMVYHHIGQYEQSSIDLIEAWRIKQDQDRIARVYLVATEYAGFRDILAVFPHTAAGLAEATARAEDVINKERLRRQQPDTEEQDIDRACVFESGNDGLVLLDYVWLEEDTPQPPTPGRQESPDQR